MGKGVVHLHQADRSKHPIPQLVAEEVLWCEILGGGGIEMGP